MAEPIETDALIIGAGPVGLFQVFQLGLLELRTHVVDPLPYPGGQCTVLYGDKPIYDIPGLPVCTGQELTDRLLEQIKPFAAPFHLSQQVMQMHTQDDGRFHVVTSANQVFKARTVFIAAGVGAFLPRQLKLPGLEAWRGKQVFEGEFPSQAAWTLETRCLVLGGEADALRCALHAISSGMRHVTLAYRREQLSAPAELVSEFTRFRREGKIDFVVGQGIGFQANADQQLTHLTLAQPDGTLTSVATDLLCVCLGLTPQLGPIAQWGLALERKQLPVDPAHFETNVPGIFAVGDINTYPGKKKLILCGFHEATLAAHRAAHLIRPNRNEPLLYTTSSPKLHRLLGV